MRVMPELWLPYGALGPVLAALSLVVAAYFLARRDRWRSAAACLAASALMLRGYAAADRVLHPWDERYHALVAKHLIDQPLHPTLYADPVLPYEYQDWYSNHIWLHKPPLTLWFQAASMRSFGVSEIPMRLPSVVFATAAVLVTFALGYVLFSPWVGFVAAVFHAFNGFLVDLASGRRPSDHVDTLLVFLVAAGILGALIAEKKWPRLVGVIVGVACGLAYLTKSVSGLLLIPIWILMRWESVPRKRLLPAVGVAALLAALVGLPWTIYAMSTFPVEWQHESQFAWRHVKEVLETHGGSASRYLAEMPRFFGELIYVPLAYALYSVINRTSSPARRAILWWIAVPYVLFSLMATKMPAYIAVAAPALFLMQAEFWLTLHSWRAVETKAWRKGLLFFCAVVLAVLPARNLLNPTGALEHRDRNPQWAQDLRDLNRAIGEGPAVVFGVPAPIEAMFYTPYVVYEYLPTAEQTAMLRDRGYRVYVFERQPADRPSVRRIDE